MSDVRNLRLDLYGSFDAGDKRHAQEIMIDLGINYVYAIPQSIADCWWFLGCRDVPEDLPSFITDMRDFDPHKAIGWGLSKEMADNLSSQHHKGE